MRTRHAARTRRARKGGAAISPAMQALNQCQAILSSLKGQALYDEVTVQRQRKVAEDAHRERCVCLDKEERRERDDLRQERESWLEAVRGDCLKDEQQTKVVEHNRRASELEAKRRMERLELERSKAAQAMAARTEKVAQSPTPVQTNPPQKSSEAPASPPKKPRLEPETSAKAKEKINGHQHVVRSPSTQREPQVASPLAPQPAQQPSSAGEKKKRLRESSQEEVMAQTSDKFQKYCPFHRATGP